jgi:hypothetical protein
MQIRTKSRLDVQATHLEKDRLLILLLKSPTNDTTSSRP